MRLTFLRTIIFAALLLLVQSCNKEDNLQELFSGTLPSFEMKEGEKVRYTEARTLFIRLMNDEVELDGQRYPIKIVNENDEQIVFSADFPLDPLLLVDEITYKKATQTLVLELGSMEKQVTLEQFDRMISRKAAEFAEVNLTADISGLSDNQKEMLRLLFKVANIMDNIYWDQVFPDRDAALASMVSEDMARFFKINYGPWERLNGNLPFLPDYGAKPAGSGYYPADMSKAEFKGR